MQIWRSVAVVLLLLYFAIMERSVGVPQIAVMVCMRVLKYGKEHEKTLVFLACTAEAGWAFADSVNLLAQDYHVMQIVYDGHCETKEDFVSVETTVDEVTDWLQQHGITKLDAAYGCSLGGACQIRFLALLPS